jgi:hypothetical protein
VMQRKKPIDDAEYAVAPSVWLALLADYRARFGLALIMNSGILIGRPAGIPSPPRKRPDFRLGRADAGLDESHSRSEARP